MKVRKKTFIGILLLVFCVACRYYTPVADFYAERLYTLISRCLSWLGSLLRISLEEIVVLAFAVTFVDILVKAVKHKEGFFHWLGKTLVVAMWLFVWFYMGWGNNYYRTGLYQRNGIQRVSYSEEAFSAFLKEYTAELNQSAAEAGNYDRDVLEADLKAYYNESVVPYGYTALKRWQHVKKPLMSSLFSAVGTQGYMGPFFCESQVNSDVLEIEYPYVTAHELAHLAGVTSEAEASWWGFDYCRKSANAAVRYSGYLSILSHVLSNAGALLPEEEFQAWKATLCEKAKSDYTASHTHWQEMRIGWLDKAQTWFYNLYLKSNGVSQGIKDYSGVVSMIMTMDAAGGTGRIIKFGAAHGDPV